MLLLNAANRQANGSSRLTFECGLLPSSTHRNIRCDDWCILVLGAEDDGVCEDEEGMVVARRRKTAWCQGNDARADLEIITAPLPTSKHLDGVVYSV